MIEEKEIVSKEKVGEFNEVELLKRLRRIRIANIWTVRIFFAVFFAVAVISFIIPLRPTYSEAEKRELAKFPKFSLSSLFSGEYFIDIDKWYSDTFPARDSITDLNTRVTMLFGKTDVLIHGEVEEGDAIPSVEESLKDEYTETSSQNSSADKELNSEDTTSKLPQNNEVSSDLESSRPVNSAASSSISVQSSSQSSSVVSSSSISGATATSSDVSQSTVSSQNQSSASSVTQSNNSSILQSTISSAVSSVAPAPITQTLGALLINGDTAYEYYNFSRETADKYVTAINRAGALLAGKAQVYDLIIPTSMGITAPESLVSSVNTSNQKAAIDYMYSKINAPVKYVPLYETLKLHSKEYIYFRTDHHWTALGAYYGYYNLMKTMGTKPFPIKYYVRHNFPGFLGSFYNSSGKLPQLAAKPDIVSAFQPPETNHMRILSNKGVWYDSNIISDMSTSSASNKYITFLRGDNPCSIITNPKLNNKKVCIVIKESFGNAFVPYLVPHYQHVFVIDYRYFNKFDSRGLVQFQADAGAQDIIFINNISATRNKTLVGYIDGFVR